MSTPSIPIPEPAAGLFVRDDDEGLFSRDGQGNLIRLDDPSEEDYNKIITLQIDGQTVQVPLARPLTDANGNLVLDLQDRTTPRYTTIYDAAVSLYVKESGDEAKIPIPVLCHQPHMKPVAVCRLCIVQIYGQKRGKRAAERKLLPACQHQINEGMEVFTMNAEGPDGDRVRGAVKTLTELLAADHLKPAPLTPELSTYNELGLMSDRCNADASRFKLDVLSNPPPAAAPLAGRRGLDDSSPVFLVDHSACILCDRCVRACDEVKANHIIGRTGKGATAGIGFDLNDPMAESGCVQCGECMVSCPTTAISFKPVAKVKLSSLGSSSEVLPARDLLADPIFTGIPPKFLLWQQGLVVRRRFRAGEVLCHQGDPGNTAFLIKSGRLQVKVYPPSPPPNESLLGVFLPRHRPAPVLQVELTPANLIFGEMACLSALPRSADVVALENGEVWELRRNVLDRLMRLPSQRRRIEVEYRQRALDLVLRSTNLFRDLPQDDHRKIVEYLRQRISFARVNPGQTVCDQGERAHDFFIIRMGHVRINVARYKNEAGRVLTRGPGSTLGEISLLGLSRDDAYRYEDEADRYLQGLFDRAGGDLTSALPAGLQTATVTALDHLELARLNRADFLEMVRLFPVIRRRLIAQTLNRLRSDEDPTALMEEYVGQGLYEARSVLVLDLDCCTRCDECTRGCIQRHGTESHGVPMTRMLRDGKRFANYMVATACRSCETPHCMTGCPVDAIHRGKHLQIVIEDHCIGCGLCAANCPYGSIFIEPNQNHPAGLPAQPKAANCDLCDSRDLRTTPNPSCVSSCPHDAAHRMTGEQLLQRVLTSADKGKTQVC
ncbi:MAG TPA: cyclic nucleotide-binding domain-containing protein [Candidatus Methylacidiphilales bacterium]|jgi:Fe-S-cluster-containing hydrogenase component 2|nr:cyclic nucleotide-binding domain-containing protein [Candidatus Methylacidiphilales bacterium]